MRTQHAPYRLRILSAHSSCLLAFVRVVLIDADVLLCCVFVLQFPQMPHYNLVEATQEAKKVMGPYYREPEPSPGPIPTHLFGMLKQSFDNDHYVADTGDIVYYQKDARV